MVAGSTPPGFEKATEAYIVFFRGDGFKGESAYAALYAQISMYREEWLQFYDEKANYVHTERACGIINTLVRWNLMGPSSVKEWLFVLATVRQP